MIDVRPVVYVIGVLLAMLAGGMLAPALIDAVAGHEDWRVFLAAAAATSFLAGGLIFATRQAEAQQLNVRQMFLLTTLSWIVIAAFAALPLRFAELRLSYVDAYFEAMSGLTTTGSTVLSGLDFMPRGTLIWRAMLQWIGGMGIIVMGLAVLPFLQVGGMQLFRTESSDRSEKIVPRATQLAANTGAVYLALTLACAASYWGAGMTGFDAAAHAMTTISTGGYSTHDASIGHYSSPVIEWIAVVFMLSGGVSFGLYIVALRGRPQAFWANEQLRWFLVFVLTVALFIGAFRYLSHDGGLHQALRHAIFSVAAIVTGTGYAATDYQSWGTFAVVAFFALSFVGGCTGSTAGGIKIFRFQILFGTMRRQFFGLTNPHGVRNPSYDGKPVPAGVPLAVTSFVFLYAVTVMVTALALALMGLDLTTSLSAAASAVGNVGPGLGDIIGPSGNYAPLPAAAKVVLALAMLLGRLELFTVFIVLTPSFWRA